jgi:hypothetical protein
MTAWYKEPKYNGAGIVEQIDLKKGYGDISKIAPLIAAGARLAAPAIAGVAAEAAKPVAQNLGQRASRHIDTKGITVPSPLGPKMKIGGDKKMLKEEDTMSLIDQQRLAAKQGRMLDASKLAERIGHLQRGLSNDPTSTDKAWREGRQNKYGKMEKQDTVQSLPYPVPGHTAPPIKSPIKPPVKKALPTDAMTMTNKSLAKSIDTFLMRKGILQKTANKSSLPLGTYQKAGDPVKRMVNNSATLQSPDVWSAGKKTTKTKE